MNFKDRKNWLWLLPGALFIFRVISMLTLPYSGVKGFGDLEYYYRLASLGIPFRDIWVEYPPVFPFFSRLIYTASGYEHSFIYGMIFLFTLVQSINISLFMKLAEKTLGGMPARMASIVYLGTMVAVPYGIWYFESLVVLSILAGLLAISKEKDGLAVGAIIAGILTKLFPGMLLVLVWKRRSLRRAIGISLLILVGVAGVYLGLYIWNPEMTTASILSQISKGPWETFYALAAGNLGTGNLGPLIERGDPSRARVLMTAPSPIHPWLVLIPFLLVGLALFLKARVSNTRDEVALLGLSFCVFFLWSPGWSPQWVLILLPLVLLVFPGGKGLLRVLLLVLINLLEWPALLSRGYNWGLWLTVPVRSLFFLLLAVEFWSRLKTLPISKRRPIAEH